MPAQGVPDGVPVARRTEYVRRLHCPEGEQLAASVTHISNEAGLPRFLNEVWCRWWHLILSLFAHTLAQPLPYTRTRTPNPGRPGCYHEVWLIWLFLVTSLRFIATTYTWSVLSSFHVVISWSCLRAHMQISCSLRSFRPPHWGACVCVCVCVCVAPLES